MFARVAMTAACVLAIVGSASAQELPRAEVQKIADAIAAAVSNGDGAAAAALFSKDGDYVSSTGRSAQGPADIEKLVKEQASGVFQGLTFKSTPLSSVRSLTPDVVVANGRFESSGARKGLTTMVLVRQGKEWKIAALRAMVPAPAPAAK